MSQADDPKLRYAAEQAAATEVVAEATPRHYRIKYDPRQCKMCLVRFKPVRVDQCFCGEKCRNSWNYRAASRGRAAYDLLVKWRRTRGKRKGVLSDLAFLVDAWLDDDRRAKLATEEGREHTPYQTRDLM